MKLNVTFPLGDATLFEFGSKSEIFSTYTVQFFSCQFSRDGEGCDTND